MESNWAQRIYTRSGFVTENVLEGKRAVDLGCGDRKLPGSVGVDSLALPAVDIVHDLSVYPWPLEDASFDLVLANHFLEHTEDVLRTLGEIHRILKPGGRVVIQVPYFRALDAFTDPTHRHFFTAGTLDYVCEGTQLGEYQYTTFKFKKIGFWYAWPQPASNLLKRALKQYIHAHTGLYDRYLSLVFPVKCVTWELEK